MLRKRNINSDSSFAAGAAVQKPRSSPSSSSSLFAGLFAGIRSPAVSPLVSKLLYGLPNSLRLRSGRSPEVSGGKVGLGVLDTLDAAVTASAAPRGKIVFGSPMKINVPALRDSAAAMVLPKNLVPSSSELAQGPFDGEMLPGEQLGKFRYRAAPPPMAGGSAAVQAGSIPPANAARRVLLLSAIEIELSEDYTCIISHGSNPKTTHIFGDYVPRIKEEEQVSGSYSPSRQAKGSSSSPVDFLSFCFSCKKKLEGKDIYIYRGEKAFCSGDCREQHIVTEEVELKKPPPPPPPPECSSFPEEEVFLPGGDGRRGGFAGF